MLVGMLDEWYIETYLRFKDNKLANKEILDFAY